MAVERERDSPPRYRFGDRKCPNPGTEALLDKIATTSGLLGEADWEEYFREQARLRAQ